MASLLVLDSTSVCTYQTEYNEYNNNLYGTSVEAVKSIQNAGKVCLLDIDINGCKAVKEKMAAKFIFITLPEPQLENLTKRLKGR